jgi:stage III sporulation protein AB
MMEECIRLCVRWDYALRSGHVRLYDFFEQYEPQEPEMAEVLAEVAERLAQNRYPSGREVWRSVLFEKRKKLLMKGEAYEILQQAGDAFFCGGSGESLHTIRICRERMERHLADTRRELSRKRQIYIPMGMLGGVVLIILLV